MARRVIVIEVSHKLFIFFLNALSKHPLFAPPRKLRYPHDMFHSLPFAPREIRATEARLQAIYDAASLGLKGDSLALAAGMMPVEYRRLCQFDPLAEMAELKGRADAEAEMAGLLREAAREGDVKATLAILQNRHDWVAKQQIQVDVAQRISITDALREAEGRVIEGVARVAFARAEPTMFPVEQRGAIAETDLHL
ncbi:hypothetical protein UFOVP920_53 [uncultured Caudovirales phage]|uniref:Uncharacterized protein n=1 Tax=uncultured Caudovirales phage TaxID=2100421 RepID=A0A6J5PKL3_9CAUD|nr:hypothetical protein UFOVP920_53 [uncultured Caudovirales phage]CAB4200623.1 hypothetical protein UFOVP1345_53 [uncultured Caudovirales phage]CAB5228925.1 hypothetical protein UFOVP1542_53 [uncultured Caudovirales phage]